MHGCRNMTDSTLNKDRGYYLKMAQVNFKFTTLRLDPQRERARNDDCRGALTLVTSAGSPEGAMGGWQLARLEPRKSHQQAVQA